MAPMGGARSAIVSSGGPAIPDSVDNHWPVDEGSGSTLTDNVGNIDSTISGAAWQSLSDAVGGSYLSYDATDDSDALDSNPRYVYNGDFTITAFARCDDDSSNLTIYGDQEGSNAGGIRFRVNNGNLGFTIEAKENTDSSLSLTQGSWHFVSARWDNSVPEVTLGVDGSYETLSTVAPSEPTNNEARWGQPGGRSDFLFNGDIDERTMAGSFLTDSDLDELRERRDDV